MSHILFNIHMTSHASYFLIIFLDIVQFLTALFFMRLSFFQANRLSLNTKRVQFILFHRQRQVQLDCLQKSMSTHPLSADYPFTSQHLHASGPSDHWFKLWPYNFQPADFCFSIAMDTKFWYSYFVFPSFSVRTFNR